MSTQLTETLLEDQEDRKGIESETQCQSLWKMSSFAANVYLSLVFQICPQMINIFLVAPYSDDQAILEGLSMSSMFVNITGFSIAVGLGSALESYGAQAYGAGNYTHVGLYLQKTVIMVLVVMTVCLTLFQFVEPALLAMNLSPETASYSQRYVNISQFGFPFLITSVLYDFYLNCQKVSRPQMWASALCFFFYPLIGWFFITHLQWGIEGCAMAMTIYPIMQCIAVVVIVRIGKFSDERTWGGLSRDAFKDLGPYVKKSLQTLVLRSVDWWAFEILTLQVGIMSHMAGKPELLAANNIIMNAFTLMFILTLGVSGAGTSLIGNSLGEGHPTLAKRYAKLMLAIQLPILVLYVLLINIFAQEVVEIMSGDEKVQAAFVSNLIVGSILIPVDNIQGLFNGILFGLGYVGFPAAVSAFLNLVLGQIMVFALWYWARLQLTGAYLGMSTGLGLTCLLYSVCVYKTDFAKTSRDIRAREASSDGSPSLLEEKHS